MGSKIAVFPGLSVAGALLIAFLAVLPARAQAALYWPTGYGLARANADGSLFDGSFIAADMTGPFVSNAGCQDVAVDGSNVYWSQPDRGAIARANSNGSGVEYNFISGLDNPCGVAVDDGSVYWTEETGGTIARANRDGGELDRSFIGGVVEPCGLEVAGGYIYWTAGKYLTRMALAGGSPQEIYEGDGSFNLCGVAADATHVYWGGFGESIGRARLDGTNPEPSFITGIERPCGIALQGSRIYWTRSGVPGAVEAADLEGPGAVRTIADHQGGGICGIAADSTALAPPAAPPPPLSHSVSFRRSKHGRHQPVTYIRMKFPQAGRFTVSSSTAVRWRILPSATAPLTLSGPEERVLKVWPATGNRSAKALRTKLRRTGRAQVAVRVQFAAADGTASTKRQWLLLWTGPLTSADRSLKALGQRRRRADSSRPQWAACGGSKYLPRPLAFRSMRDPL